MEGGSGNRAAFFVSHVRAAGADCHGRAAPRCASEKGGPPIAGRPPLPHGLAAQAVLGRQNLARSVTPYWRGGRVKAERELLMPEPRSVVLKVTPRTTSSVRLLTQPSIA